MTPTVASDIAADLQELVNLVFTGLTKDFKALIEDYTWKDQGKGKKAGETLVLHQTLFNDWDKDPNAAAFKMLTWGFNAWRAKKYLASDWLPSFVSTNNVRSTIEKFCHGTSASATATWRLSSWTKVLAVRHPDQYNTSFSTPGYATVLTITWSIPINTPSAAVFPFFREQPQQKRNVAPKC